VPWGARRKRAIPQVIGAGQVRRLFALTGMDSVIEVYPSVADARAGQRFLGEVAAVAPPVKSSSAANGAGGKFGGCLLTPPFPGS
jgi:hypothetical protein